MQRARSTPVPRPTGHDSSCWCFLLGSQPSMSGAARPRAGLREGKGRWKITVRRSPGLPQRRHPAPGGRPAWFAGWVPAPRTNGAELSAGCPPPPALNVG